ncbi:WecB/TagA/CpsF family glycosyltransferase [Methyloceanibacter sp.]|uniref:WecB/TagA/CpsF family glycosyltransferase n=1 Tax=Methyloceanibacter sp. TaxID=1965321 RepID=UPI003D6C9DB8
MFIVHVVRQFHPGVGGLESVVHELASAQVGAGHRVRVVTLDRLFNMASRQKLPASETLDGIEIERIPYFGSSRYPIAPSVLRHIKGAGLVHVHAIDFFFDFLAWTKPIHGRTLVASTHGGFFHTGYAAWLKRRWFSTVTRLSMTFYAGIAAVSASDFERFRPVRPKGMVCIENGANVAKFHDGSSATFRKSMLAIGRFAKNKRIDLLIDFVWALRQRDPEWTLTIAGRPGDLTVEDVSALDDGAGLRGAVTIVASPDDAAVKALMRSCSFLASSSDYEGFGVAAIEGMSAGLIPLLSGIPPFRRLVARTGLGMVIDYSDPDVAARGFLQNLGGIAADYAGQRAACMRAAAEFDWRHVYQDYAKLYDAVTGGAVKTVLDVPVQVQTFDQAVKLIDARYESREGVAVAVAFANAHTLNVAAGNPAFRLALQNALVFNDGLGVDIASRILYGSAFPENLNGTDFVPNYLRRTKHRYRIYLLGAKPGIAERAAHRLSASYPQHTIVGCHHGHFDAAETSKIAELIRRSKADIVLVAMGNPKQELFIKNHLAATSCALGIGVGALFDFVAGDVPRAPLWVQGSRLEWVYRLLQEPSRLAGRYLIGNPLFLMRIFGQWWSGSRVKDAGPVFVGGAQAILPKPHAAADRDIARRKAA